MQRTPLPRVFPMLGQARPETLEDLGERRELVQGDGHFIGKVDRAFAFVTRSSRSFDVA